MCTAGQRLIHQRPTFSRLVQISPRGPTSNRFGSGRRARWHGRLTVWSSCQMAAVRAKVRRRARVSCRVFPPWLSRSSGVVDSLDDLVRRVEAVRAGCAGSPWQGGRSRCIPARARAREIAAVVVLVADHHLAGQQGHRADVIEWPTRHRTTSCAQRSGRLDRRGPAQHACLASQNKNGSVRIKEASTAH